MIEATVGYMLKVLKSGLQLTSYKNEFSAIRHGDFYEFINLIGEPIPFMISWKHGVISTEKRIEKDDIDFEGLLKAGPSLIKFYKLCKAVYGDINDSDLSDTDFQNAVSFEIALRMHANKRNLLQGRTDLKVVIEKLCSFQSVTESDKNQLHQGRRFINMIKHFKNQFNSWEEGKTEFNKAFEIIVRHNWTIV